MGYSRTPTRKELPEMDETKIIAKLEGLPGHHFEASNGVCLDIADDPAGPEVIVSMEDMEWLNVRWVTQAIDELMSL